MSDLPIILYIEDNLNSRKLVERLLTAYRFAVHTVPDGEAGFQFVEKQTPDLILLDINLPRMDGYAIAKQMRQQEKLATTPIIALTANVMQQDRLKSLAAGCNGFIEKPINVDSLADEIRSYLNPTRKIPHGR